MQAQYTDVLLVVSPPLSLILTSSNWLSKQNKWEHISERALDDVLEHLNTLNELTPKIRCVGKSVDPALIFGIDSDLFRDAQQHPPAPIKHNNVTQHHDEVETVTLLRAAPAPVHVHTDACNHAHTHPHDHPEELTAAAHDSHAPNRTSSAPPPPPPPLDEPTLAAALQRLPKESVYRVKGFIRFVSAPNTSIALAEDAKDRGRSWWILNWAFGRWELVRAPASSSIVDDEGDGGEAVRLTVMGERAEVRRYARKLAQALGAAVVV
jgi:G3E family GTPase